MWLTLPEATVLGISLSGINLLHPGVFNDFVTRLLRVFFLVFFHLTLVQGPFVRLIVRIIITPTFRPVLIAWVLY